jgi:hypothetical protein
MRLLSFKKTSDAINPTHRREKGYIGSVITILPTGEEIAEARFYMPGNVAYCCFWARGKYEWASASASAGGGGYCKRSAAFDTAIRKAGFELSESVNARGMNAVQDAMKAIGGPGCIVIETHG